jgi:hypothetical protein
MADRTYPMQAFAALKAAKPPATARGRERQDILIREAQKTALQRDRVAKHEWAKQRVCSILRLARFDQWSGYIPPALDADGRANRTTERRLLIDLGRELGHFEQTGELPDYATE